MNRFLLAICFPLLIGATVTFAADETFAPEQILGKEFAARDTLDCNDEANADAKACLLGLAWKPAAFKVTCQTPPEEHRGDALIRFPSAVPSGDETNDSVTMEWYFARNEQQQPIIAPAVVVVHESGSKMPVGRIIARGLCGRGFHAFLIHLPHYGHRRGDGKRPDGFALVASLRQAIADVRRARDAVAALPVIDASHIALQGTSLGGFVSATTAGLDNAYNNVFITLAGGELYDLIQNGKRDTAEVREKLAKAGVSGEQLRLITQTIEPTRLAHRYDPQHTWIYSATFDTIVPLKNATALAKAAKLPETHHIKMIADHFSGIIYLPYILDHMRDQMNGVDPLLEAK